MHKIGYCGGNVHKSCCGRGNGRRETAAKISETKESQKTKAGALAKPGSSAAAASKIARPLEFAAAADGTTLPFRPRPHPRTQTKRPPSLSWPIRAVGTTSVAPSITITSYGPLRRSAAGQRPGDDRHIWHSPQSAASGLLEQGVVLFERNDRAGQLCQQRRRITGAAADIEHAVGLADLGGLHELRQHHRLEHPPRRRAPPSPTGRSISR